MTVDFRSSFRSQNQPALESLTGYTETILIVDDEEMVTSASRRMLQYLGYTVLTANSGKEGLAIYREDPQAIDLILLDMMMPGLDGAATYEALKRCNPAVRVLLSSGFSLDNQTRGILSKGGTGFIQKPYTLREIAAKIRTVLAAEV